MSQGLLIALYQETTTIMKQFLTTAAMLLSMAAKAQTGQVELTVTGIDPAVGGELSAGMFNEANFPN